MIIIITMKKTNFKEIENIENIKVKTKTLVKENK